MRFLFYAMWNYEKEFVTERGAQSVTLTYRSAGVSKTYYWKDFGTFESLAIFLDGYDGYRMLYQDGREMVDCMFLGVASWPEELQQPFMGLYLDYLGW